MPVTITINDGNGGVTVVNNDVPGIVVTSATAPGPQGPTGPEGPAGAGAVSSVNEQTGDVVLDAEDVGAIPQGGTLTADLTTGGFALRDGVDVGGAGASIGVHAHETDSHLHFDAWFEDGPNSHHAELEASSSSTDSSVGMRAVSPTVDRRLTVTTEGAAYEDSSDPTNYFPGAVLMGQGSDSQDQARAIRIMTQTEYDALVSPDAQTVYFVLEDP